MAIKIAAAVIAVAFGVVGTAQAAPVQWETSAGGNGHWYDFVNPGSGVAADSKAAAEASTFMGMSGYLATITSAAEQAFLNTLWPGEGSVTGQFGNRSYYLIGARDITTDGIFEWTGGPEAGQTLADTGYENWGPSEPNNSGVGNYTVGWWNDSSDGRWNDVSATGANFAYVVEYSAPPVATVPLPASGLLLFGGLAAAAAVTRTRRRNAA